MADLTPVKTIQVPPDCHQRLVDDARACNDAKLKAMFIAYQRGWAMLTPEQQMQAIRTDSQDDALASALDDRPRCLSEEADNLTCDVATLAKMLGRFLSDGDLNTSEKKQLRPIMKIVKKRAERVACGAGV